MEKRKEINDRLALWIEYKVKTEYADDISLVLLYGSHINGTAGRKSDLDCYFIPKTQRGYDLAVTFILEGVGYDLFPISWERAERIANLQESLLPLIGDVRILYCNCPEDARRFAALQARLRENLSDDAYVKKIAESKCEEAGRLCALLDQHLTDGMVRKTAGTVIMALAEAIALSNHDYFHRGLKKQFEDLQNHFPDVPRTIVTGYRNVVEAGSIGDVIRHTKTMFADVCAYLDITPKIRESTETAVILPNPPAAAYLAGLYQEILSTFNKIYVCCETGNHILAFLSAVCLQHELDDARAAGVPACDLLKNFDYRDLRSLSNVTRSIQIGLVQLILDNGGLIREYPSFEAFESANL